MTFPINDPLLSLLMQGLQQQPQQQSPLGTGVHFPTQTLEGANAFQNNMAALDAQQGYLDVILRQLAEEEAKRREDERIKRETDFANREMTMREGESGLKQQQFAFQKEQIAREQTPQVMAMQFFRERLQQPVKSMGPLGQEISRDRTAKEALEDTKAAFPGADLSSITVNDPGLSAQSMTEKLAQLQSAKGADAEKIRSEIADEIIRFAAQDPQISKIPGIREILLSRVGGQQQPQPAGPTPMQPYQPNQVLQPRLGGPMLGGSPYTPTAIDKANQLVDSEREKYMKDQLAELPTMIKEGRSGGTLGTVASYLGMKPAKIIEIWVKSGLITKEQGSKALSQLAGSYALSGSNP